VPQDVKPNTHRRATQLDSCAASASAVCIGHKTSTCHGVEYSDLISISLLCVTYTYWLGVFHSRYIYFVYALLAKAYANHACIRPLHSAVRCFVACSTGGHKNMHTCFVRLSYQILTDFQNHFTVAIRRKFVITLTLKFPPHLKCRPLYTVSRNMLPNFCPYLRQILTNFQNSFTGILCGKSAIRWLLNSPQHLSCIAILHCEILM